MTPEEQQEAFAAAYAQCGGEMPLQCGAPVLNGLCLAPSPHAVTYQLVQECCTIGICEVVLFQCCAHWQGTAMHVAGLSILCRTCGRPCSMAGLQVRDVEVSDLPAGEFPLCGRSYGNDYTVTQALADRLDERGQG